LILIDKFWFSFIILPLFPFAVTNEAFAESNLESGIEEISENQFVDEMGYVHVLGEIQNKLNTKMDFVKVNVAYYDSQSRIIGSDFVYSDPNTLLPGQTATYQTLTSPSSLASSDVSTVKVRYEYEVDGVTQQSLSPISRPLTRNTGQPLGQQNDLAPSDVPMGPDDPDCGKVIHGNFTLTANLVCKSNDGLIVGGDNTTINLNGYSITGPGVDSQKVGIAIPHSDNVVIEGSGGIRSFQAGVLITGSDGTNIHRVTFEGNKIAVFMTGSNGSTIEENFIGPNTIGVASHSSIGSQIHANMMTGNNLAGVTMVNSNRTQIDANSIGGSRNGIFLDYQSNKNMVENNTALKNDIDINNADGLSLNINRNELLKNNCLVSQPSGYCIGQ
jgi:hypothetical protein